MSEYVFLSERKHPRVAVPHKHLMLKLLKSQRRHLLQKGTNMVTSKSTLDISIFSYISHTLLYISHASAARSPTLVSVDEFVYKLLTDSSKNILDAIPRLHTANLKLFSNTPLHRMLLPLLYILRYHGRMDDVSPFFSTIVLMTEDNCTVF